MNLQMKNGLSCVCLQVVTNRDTLETLLCIAYVFEVSTSEHGAQHHIYRLVKDWHRGTGGTCQLFVAHLRATTPKPSTPWAEICRVGQESRETLAASSVCESKKRSWTGRRRSRRRLDVRRMKEYTLWFLYQRSQPRPSNHACQSYHCWCLSHFTRACFWSPFFCHACMFRVCLRQERSAASDCHLVTYISISEWGEVTNKSIYRTWRIPLLHIHWSSLLVPMYFFFLSLKISVIMYSPIFICSSQSGWKDFKEKLYSQFDVHCCFVFLSLIDKYLTTDWGT